MIIDPRDPLPRWIARWRDDAMTFAEIRDEVNAYNAEQAQKFEHLCALLEEGADEE